MVDVRARAPLDASGAARLSGARRGTGREVERTPAGLEAWKQTEAGPLITRTADIPWLAREFERHGVVLRQRLPAEFTELYTKVSRPSIAGAIHRWNELCFRRVRRPGPAGGNVLILDKSA
jgi:hypothetical protein